MTRPASLVIAMFDGQRTEFALAFQSSRSNQGCAMRLKATILSLPLLVIMGTAVAARLPGDYGAVDIDTALKKSAADGRPIMLFASAGG